MHPMFVKLFMEADEDDALAYEQEKRQRSRRAKRHQARVATRGAVRAPVVQRRVNVIG